MSVVDASLLIDVLVGLPAGRPWRGWLTANPALAVPDCAGVELGRYLRRHTLSGILPASDALRSLEAFVALGVESYPTAALLADAFALRDTVSFDDGLYVALAQRLGDSLATTDVKLARAAAALGVTVATPE